VQAWAGPDQMPQMAARAPIARIIARCLDIVGNALS
jgi:hypothetical protein